MFNQNPTLRAWIADCIWKKFQFATIQTTNAVYDRAAVIFKSDRLLTVEFPKLDRKKNVSIKRENVNRSEITNLKFYRD